ncbi:uncharacterized protein LOC117218211 [Megalopta genalis]|uniref:uncharacterized protein LOC117218211 n=1 Tax=Megalopta genalis TaxID=115081 RepID=UPI003FCF3085
MEIVVHVLREETVSHRRRVPRIVRGDPRASLDRTRSILDPTRSLENERGAVASRGYFSWIAPEMDDVCEGRQRFDRERVNRDEAETFVKVQMILLALAIGCYTGKNRLLRKICILNWWCHPCRMTETARQLLQTDSLNMSDEISIFLVVVLAIGGLMMISALLACYACIFRDLCCRQEDRTKRRRVQNPRQERDDPNRPKMDAILLNDITQGESMPTESDKV